MSDTSTAMAFVSATSAILNYAAGFDTGFSFYYTAVKQPWGGEGLQRLKRVGDLVSHLDAARHAHGRWRPDGAFSPFVPMGVTFAA